MNICVFGDSIAWGAYDPENGGWATLLRNHYESKEAGISVYCLGVCGETSSTLLERVEAEARARQPEILVFAIGINDSEIVTEVGRNRTTLPKFSENLLRLHQIASSIATKTLFIGLTQIDEEQTSRSSGSLMQGYSDEHRQAFDHAIKLFCEDCRIPYVPMTGVLSAAELCDGIHPNSQGHRVMFERIRSSLDRIVSEK